MKKGKDGLQSALRGIEKPSLTPSVISSCKIEGAVFDHGWGSVGRTSFSDKTPDQWNKKDLVNYYYRCYFSKFGKLLSSPPPYCLEYINLQTITTALEIQFGFVQDTCPKVIIKDYFDFFYARFADTLSSQGVKMGMFQVAKMKWISTFIRHYREHHPVHHEPVSVAVQPVTVCDTVSLQDLDSAYRIHSQYFLANYGVILPIAYLMLIKNMDEEKATAYVRRALIKMKGDTESVVESTQRYQPYPKWFPFQMMSEFFDVAIRFSDDNTTYTFLRSFIGTAKI